MPMRNALKRLLHRLLPTRRTTSWTADPHRDADGSTEPANDGTVREPDRTITMYAIAHERNLTMLRDPDTGTVTLPNLRSDLAAESDEETGLMLIQSLLGITIEDPRRLESVDVVHEGIMTRVGLVYGTCDPFPSSPYCWIHTTSPLNTSLDDDPLIGGPVMRIVMDAFMADEAEATGPSPYQDIGGRPVISNAHATWTNGDAIKVMTSLLLARGRIDRVLWNAFQQGHGSVHGNLAAAPLSFMAELGMGFEDLPEELEMALRGDPRAPYQGGLAWRLTDTYRRYAAIRIPREWHPSATRRGHTMMGDHMRGRWKALCDQVAEPLGLKPRYGVLVEAE